MQFGSFIPRRNSDSRPTPPPADSDATEVSPAWSSTLHRHLTAQNPPPTPVTAPVGPPVAPTGDGFRQPVSPNIDDISETQVFPRIARPNYYPTQMYPTVPAPPAPPTPPTPTTQFQDPTDIGALMYQEQQSRTYAERRVLEYYGNPQIKNIIPVVGTQIHKVTAQGVVITENGPNMLRTLIPWARVHSFHFAPGDPIVDNL